MTSKIKFCLKLLFVCLIFYWISTKINLDQITAQLKKVSLWPLMVSIFLFSCNRILTAIKWNLLLIHHGIHVTLKKIIRIIFVSNFLSLIFPTTLSIDVFRFIEIQKQEKNTTAALGSIFVDRLIAILMLAVLNLIAFIPAFHKLPNLPLKLTIIGIALGITICILISMTQTPLKLFKLLQKKTTIKGPTKKLFTNTILVKIKKKIETIHASLNALYTTKAHFITICFLNLIFQIIRVMQFHFLFLSIDVHIPLSIQFVLIPSIILAIITPITFFGLGLKEGAFVSLYTLINIPTDISLSVSLLSYLLLLGGVIPGAVLFLFSNKSQQKQN